MADGTDAGAGHSASAGSGQRSPGFPSGPAPTPPGGLPDLGDRVQARDGTVTIALSAPSYHHGTRIVAVITNGLRRTIYTQNAKSDCSILFLQRRDGASWTDVPGCAVRIAPVTIAIGGSHARTIVIDLSSGNFANGAPAPSLPSGAYRLRLTYGFAGAAGEEPMAAASAPFDLVT